MILDSIVLENFGVFGGRQEADLMPESGKPVILFGGLNGGGKTTILEALQLGFYGPKARLASRATTPYKDYLREAIHRGADLSAGAAITIRFRRVVEGEARLYEMKRRWHVCTKGLEEIVQVWCNGEPNQLLTDNWSEYIEGYLPSGIAHLFFFDGEQIKELAEGEHAAEILGTAIQTLLGLDIVDRLETDLKVLERRKRAEVMDDEAVQQLARLEEELQLADSDQAKAIQEQGRLSNEIGVLAKSVREIAETFRLEGGETFERRHAIEAEQQRLQHEQAAAVARLRELAAGSAPLLLVGGVLAELEQVVRDESDAQQARIVVRHITERDSRIMDAMLREKAVSQSSRKMLERWLAKDRKRLESLVATKTELNGEPHLAPEIAHVRRTVLPELQREIEAIIATLTRLDEALGQVQIQLARVPAADAVARLQQRLEAARSLHRAKLTEHAAAGLGAEACKRHKEHLERQIEQLGLTHVDERFAGEDRQRLLKHAEKVRATLAAFRTAVIRKNASRLESLILESFQHLLRKTRLVTGLRIDPETFGVTLLGADGHILPFSRLSAGERQLLATSLLWGLARASGRPIPTVIDTPLGRLDSSHRHHLVERYFPVASHQVILLSTDEEIAKEYHDGIKPYLTRQFLLSHDEVLNRTSIIPDNYFTAHEATG